jgi:O-antigen/teichoic acid export membrane protein
VIPPIIAELYAQRKTRQLERAMRAGATFAGLPAFGVLLIFLLFGPWVLGTIFGPAYRDGATILAILSIGRLYAIWTGAAGAALMMTGHERAMMTITLTCGALSVLVGIACAYLWGAIGIACSTASIQILQNSLQMAFVRRRLGIWTMIYFSPFEIYRYLRPRRAKDGPSEGAA